MVIATMAAVISNEHEMEREKSSQIWQFSCHKELEVGINRHHRSLSNCAKSTFFQVSKSIKYRLRNRQGSVKWNCFIAKKQKQFEEFGKIGKIECVDSSPQDDV